MPALPGETFQVKVRTRALVTLVVGGDYASNFERYAGKIGQRTQISLLDTSPRATARPIYWQKNLILEGTSSLNTSGSLRSTAIS